MICGEQLSEALTPDWYCSDCKQYGCSNGSVFVPLLSSDSPLIAGGK